MTDSERNTAAMRLYWGLVDSGMTPAASEALASTVFDLPKDNDLMRRLRSRVEHTGVFGLWDKMANAWATSYDAIVYGPNCVMQAQLRQLEGQGNEGVYDIREFDVFGQPILESVEEAVLSEA